MDKNRGLWCGKTTPKSSGEAFDNIWVEGDLVHSEEFYYIHPVANTVKVKGELGQLIVMHKVDPSTLGECTRFSDKNDNTSFEGDIVTFKYGSETIIGFVEYDRYSNAFIVNDGIYSYIFGSDVFGGECEIIGNIHDNPELMKGADDDG